MLRVVNLRELHTLVGLRGTPLRLAVSGRHQLAFVVINLVPFGGGGRLELFCVSF